MPIRHIISQCFGHMCLNIGELRHEAGNSIGSRDGDRLRD